MSCAGIISIPLVLACMQSVRAMERAEEGEEEEGHLLYSSYYRFHRQGTIGLDTGCSKAGHHFCQPFKVKREASNNGHVRTTTIWAPQMSATWKSSVLKEAGAELLGLCWKH